MTELVGKGRFEEAEQLVKYHDLDPEVSYIPVIVLLIFYSSHSAVSTGEETDCSE